MLNQGICIVGARPGTWISSIHGSPGIWEEIGCHYNEKEAGYTGSSQTTNESKFYIITIMRNEKEAWYTGSSQMTNESNFYIHTIMRKRLDIQDVLKQPMKASKLQSHHKNAGSSQTKYESKFYTNSDLKKRLDIQQSLKGPSSFLASRDECPGS